ncbi:branched-chain amino acid ABC transporter permease, partial [Actinomadura geliboluensis]
MSVTETGTGEVGAPDEGARRSAAVRDGLGVGIAVGMSGLAF